jgi:electron transfer flavoprotein alpha subunit
VNALSNGYTVDDEQKAVWVFVEQQGSAVEGVSLELLAKARQLADDAGWTIVGLLPGWDLDGLVDQVLARGVDELRLIRHPDLADFEVEAFTEAVSQALVEARPSIFLLGATPNGRDLAGRLAVRLKTGLNADCTDLAFHPGSGLLRCEVTGFGGGVLALLEIPRRRPQMATVRAGVFSADGAAVNRQGKIIEVDVALHDGVRRTRQLEKAVSERIDLTQATVLVCGGRGVEGEFGLLRELAELLGGDVGATRPPVDQGYIERERQIGQTGVVCRPRVALAVGISGAFHFTVGIEKAEVIVAVNNDPEAPIFDLADYGIVGDAGRVLAALIAELRAERERVHA